MKGAGLIFAAVAGFAIIGVIIYLATRPSPTISIPAGAGGGGAGGDPGWAFGSSVAQGVTSITNSIIGAFNRPAAPATH